VSEVGILVLTHGRAGVDMVDTVARMLGADAVRGMLALEIEVADGKAQTMERVRRAIAQADTGAGVVVCCDLHGATPTNCAVELSAQGRVAVLSGVNLPMLLKLATAPRGAPPEAVARAAVDTAVRSIRVEAKESIS
jgi:mannose PTS system EIIA component